ncbi:O-antigen/teichoic acid export membrane protein [Haloferula luteola]|uniref:O-antigen/teichoic acid export membrane protein n=1 Tax=Haloferula luteola TaxID=595692 RepID=A0A840UXL0_9BACT|nr:oligosaccharide flippase family protein [Haloferula luteola]MBB5350897.1 O-antigen/teichoic acid export membrane protein [Haloferula luteola]
MAEWQRRFWSTTASGYVALVTRMISGLVMFRLMFQHFSEAEFGFWALLWSLFGYGILLDFGFGFTAQKAVAEKTATGDREGLSRLLATIFWTFVGMAGLLLTVFLLIRGPFLARMGVHAEDHPEFAQAYTVFFIGLAFMFPLGLFPEILRGLQRIDIANWFGTLSTVLNFGFLGWGLHAGWSLPCLMAVSVVSSAFPNLIAAFYSLRRLEGVSFSPRWFEWRSVKAQMGFSIAAYLITFSNMLMGKSDQLVLSLTIGVAFVAVYQAGFKASEMLGLFSSQLQQVLSPAAASLHALGDKEGLRRLLLSSSRLVFLLVTPCYLLAAVYLEPLIRLLTGLEAVPRETWLVGQALLFATFSSQLTSGSSKRVLMMCGDERQLLFISLVDAAINLVLSIILAFKLGVLGVALGTFFPTVLVGWLWIVPLTVRRLELRWTTYLSHHLQGTVAPLAAFTAVLLLLRFAYPLPEDGGLIGLGWRGLVCMVPLLFLGRGVIRQMARA